MVIIYTLKELKETLKPIGKMNVISMSSEIKKLHELLLESETVEKSCVGINGIKLFLIVRTDSRLLVIRKKGLSGVDSFVYEIHKIANFHTERTATSDSINFTYNEEKIKLGITKENNSENFALELEKLFADSTSDETPQGNGITKSTVDKKAPNVFIDILNGKQDLGYEGSLFQLLQETPGEVRLKVDYKLVDEVFHLVGFERTENIKKSAASIAAWTITGNQLFGTAGALAGGLASSVGKDKSTAVIYLVRKSDLSKITLVIKCDQKVLEKLSVFIVSKDFKDEPETPSNDLNDLVKLKELFDSGVITEEEFTAKKKQLLGL